MLNFKTTDKAILKAEEQLASLPNKCSCQMCTASKNLIKKEIGEKRYNKICKELGKVY